MADKTEIIKGRNNKFRIVSVEYSDNATDDLSEVKEIYAEIIANAIIRKKRLESINKEDNEKKRGV